MLENLYLSFIYFSPGGTKVLKKIREFWNSHWGVEKELIEIHHIIVTYYQMPKIRYHKFMKHQSAWFYDFYQPYLKTLIRAKEDRLSYSQLEIHKKVQSKDKMWRKQVTDIV